MTYVVDASVAVKWFVREPLHREATQLLHQSSELHAPDWIVLEVAHAAFKKWRDQEVASEQANNMVLALPGFITHLHPATNLTGRALSIAMATRHPVYDCLYIACAEMNESVVITADDRLCRAVEGSEFARLVRHVSMFQTPDPP